tara:strand:- start:538537 stop:539538 length:1002 start_codon:yes stop_codon:yes gene_type:complete
MKFIKNNDILIDKWSNLISASKQSSPFQTIEFYNFYNTTENLSADVFAIEDNNVYQSLAVVTVQKETGFKSYFSRRAIIYGGIVLENDGGTVYLDELLKNIISYYKGKAIFVEIRNNFDYGFSKQIFEKNNWMYEEHLNVQLNLEETNLEELVSKMKYNRRREIRLSLKEGAIVRPAESVDEVNQLYIILEDMYAERVKLPLHPCTFFINLFKSEIGKIFVVIHENKIIGGSFCVYQNKMTLNTLYYTGLRNYHKKIFPTHLAIYGALDFALENNLKILDFMGAGKPGVDYGVRDYKLQFGGDLVEYGRFTYVLNSLLFKVGTFGLNLIKKFK